MAKLESTFKNMVLTLFAITAITSVTLGYVYELTKEPIAKAKMSKKIEAIKKVVPPFNNDPNSEQFSVTLDDQSICEVYPAKMDDSIVGYAVKTFSNKGFGGLVWLMVGFDARGNIMDISVLEHKETPGLGTKMDSESFRAQFRGKNPQQFNIKVRKDGGEVDAITAATISSRAFCDALGKAYQAFTKGGVQ
ncbi:MAG TPA: RnfABCDGE type electron transport complex subunit G [Salinivirgaceae bacterium]|nr:RnfABCDGE type electron transport complex subunit G [Salinivirgaceae bacterium]